MLIPIATKYPAHLNRLVEQVEEHATGRRINRQRRRRRVQADDAAVALVDDRHLGTRCQVRLCDGCLHHPVPCSTALVRQERQALHCFPARDLCARNLVGLEADRRDGHAFTQLDPCSWRGRDRSVGALVLLVVRGSPLPVLSLLGLDCRRRRRHELLQQLLEVPQRQRRAVHHIDIGAGEQQLAGTATRRYWCGRGLRRSGSKSCHHRRRASRADTEGTAVVAELEAFLAARDGELEFNCWAKWGGTSTVLFVKIDTVKLGADARKKNHQNYISNAFSL